MPSGIKTNARGPKYSNFFWSGSALLLLISDEPPIEEEIQMNAPFDPSNPTINELMAAALGLSKSSTPLEISAILKQAAAIDLMPLETDGLLDRIKEKTGAKISSLRKEHKTHQQNAKLSIEEIAEMIALAVLDKHYAGGARLKGSKPAPGVHVEDPGRHGADHCLSRERIVLGRIGAAVPGPVEQREHGGEDASRPLEPHPGDLDR
jgi:hypothetical protein